jgi:hypothetical protein
MTGLVQVIRPNASAFSDVVAQPERFRSAGNRPRVDGRDKPGHDGIDVFSAPGAQVGSRPSSRRAPIRSRNVANKLTTGLDQPLITLKSCFNVS